MDEKRDMNDDDDDKINFQHWIMLWCARNEIVSAKINKHVFVFIPLATQ